MIKKLHLCSLNHICLAFRKKLYFYQFYIAVAISFRDLTLSFIFRVREMNEVSIIVYFKISLVVKLVSP